MRAVIVDSREPGWCKKLRLSGIEAKVQELPAGDAWLLCEDVVLVVERKTLSDLCASIADGRLFNQVAAMRKASDWCYVVVSPLPSVTAGKLVVSGKPTNWQWSSVQGALLTVRELGAVLVWAESDASYGATLEWLANRDRGEVVIEPRRQGVMETPAETLLTSIPGIGSGRAGALLEHCGTAAWALDYLTGSGGGNVPGIGASTKAATRHALGLEDQFTLSVIYDKEESDE